MSRLPPELATLVSEAQSYVNMLRSDLSDLAEARQPPDGPNGLVTAVGRVHAIRQTLAEIEAFAKRRGISLHPRIPLPPRSREDRRGDEVLF